VRTDDPRLNLLDPSLDGLRDVVRGWGEPAFRAGQIYRHLYVNLATSAAAMSDLPAALRDRVDGACSFGRLALRTVIRGDHGLTRKALFALGDGSPVETVLMVYPDRSTVCVSSQSGCPMACVFCATGTLGFLHDLATAEIVEQVLWAARELRSIRHSALGTRPLSNVVFMGMGEPFNNYDNWWGAVERLHDPKGFNLGARSFTVSTVGLVPGILRLSRERLPVNLAVSLHAPDDRLRSELMPVNRRYPLGDLIAATREYMEITHRRVSFEYVLLRDKNDLPEHAEALARLLRAHEPGGRPLLCHVNLIPWNPVPGTPLGTSERRRVRAFQAILEQRRVPCTVRIERGVRIAAACGQLAGSAAIERAAPADVGA
jgi:23S rRNA (adenine2503-C2)-methyltransferase